MSKIKFYNGQVTRISNWSGHYLPTVQQGEFFPQILRQIGIKVSGAKLQLYNQEGVLVKSIRIP